jgi:hypothetical protein
MGNPYPSIDDGLMNELVNLLEGFAGADIEAAIREVVKEAFLKGDEAVSDVLFRRSFLNVVPLSKTSPEQIESIQAWGRERAVPASGQPIGGTNVPVKGRRAVLV